MGGIPEKLAQELTKKLKKINNKLNISNDYRNMIYIRTWNEKGLSAGQIQEDRNKMYILGHQFEINGDMSIEPELLAILPYPYSLYRGYNSRGCYYSILLEKKVKAEPGLYGELVKVL